VAHLERSAKGKFVRLKFPQAFVAAIMVTLLSARASIAAELISEDGLVKLYQNLSWLPHGGATYTLEFKNRRYSNFFGVGYSVVAEKDAIVFFTQREGWSTYLHVVPLHEGKELTIKIGENTLGSGFGRPPEDFASHYIEKIEGDKIYFIAKAYASDKEGIAYRCVVDLKTAEFKELGSIRLTDAKASNQARPVSSMTQESPKK
jgi:hypothetical protein